MKSAPNTIDGLPVVCFSAIDARHTHTGHATQIVAGVVQGAAAGIAICRDEHGHYYVFGCDENWQTITDTWHQTLGDARSQAEFEYAGVSETWQEGLS